MSGAALSVLTLTVPESVEQTYGTMRVGALTAQAAIAAEPPLVRLGREGGIELLDACDGSFSEMVSYRGDGSIPVFAAHNNCGGDVIHLWEVGSTFRIDGRPGLFEVVDTRDTPKTDVTTRELAGLQGDFALQTCYYGINQMKFVGAKPVG